MSRTVRAKMRCNSIKLMRSSAYTKEFQKLLDENDGHWHKAAALAEEQGVEMNREFDQPTVELQAVVDDGSGENKAFWSATPSGSVTMTISNPDAAEHFELAKHYYVDFTLAD